MFDVYFDHIKLSENHHVHDFLTVRPKVSLGDNLIVGICVLPQYKDSFALMKGWRHQFNEEIWQAPAGFAEPKEDPSVTALRELREETSLTCSSDDLVLLGSFIPDAGLVQGRVALYLAMNCVSTSDKVSYEIGMGKLHYFSKDQLMELICQTSNIGGSTVTTCMRALNYLSRL